VRIAYLIPEFPGQTHNFFWRERAVLVEMGISVDIFSTRLPPTRNDTTSWGWEAKGITNYLYPVQPLQVGKDFFLVILTRPLGIAKWLSSIARSTDTTVSQKVRLLALGLLVTEEAVIDQLELASIFVLASMEEPLGVAIMEAMSMGVPVIATNAGGVPELIENRIDGWLVTPGSVNSLMEAIIEVVESPADLRRVTERAREKIIQNFSHRLSPRAISDALKYRP